jgi:hypothetical protein
MKLLVTILVAVGAFVALAVLFSYVQIAYYTPAGFNGAESSDITRPILLSAFSLLGILSKGVLGVMLRPQARQGGLGLIASALSPEKIIRAIVVCPLVILSLYHSLQQITDIILVALIAYQNGFFFEAILHAEGRGKGPALERAAD